MADLVDTSADLLVKLALGYGSRGKYDKAEQMYKQALDKDPSHAGACYEYANMLAQTSTRYYEASKLLERCLAVNPEHQLAVGLYAQVLEESSPAMAASLHERAYQADSTNILRLRNYAIFLEKMDENARAEALYKEALLLEPDNQEQHIITLNALGSMYENMDRFDEASDCFEQILALEANNMDAVTNLSTILYNKAEACDDLPAVKLPMVKRAVELLERIPVEERDALQKNYLYCKALETQLEGGGQQEGHCAQCQKPALNKCKKCNKVAYCSKDCQTEHWKMHKKVCCKLLAHPEHAPLKKICPVCKIECDCIGALQGQPEFGVHDQACIHTMHNQQADSIRCSGAHPCAFLITTQ